MSQPGKTLITVLLTAVVVGTVVYYWQTPKFSDSPTPTIIEDKNNQAATPDEPQNLLYKKPGYQLPFGSAIVEGYYTTVERPTSLDNSTPSATCSAFVVTDGPALLLSALTGEMYGIPPTVVLGSKDSSWGVINASTKEKPIQILVTLNPVFEGELIGCMSWPFSSFTEIESGEQQSNLKNYSSAKYSFKYPSNYVLEENFGVKQQEGTPLKILSVKGTEGRIEIFRMSDFGDRPWGFAPEEGQEEILQKEIDGYLPKETLTVGSGENKYDVWLFYSDNDETTKSELKSIFGSIEIR